MKLQLFLSHNGICSRRKAMTMIQNGHVKVNGRVETEPSCQIDPLKDKVVANGKVVGQKNYQTVMLNKPAGYVTTTTDRFGEKTVIDLLPKELKHLKPVGRLDKNTEGLLLLTNDGALANRLMHPKYQCRKVYMVIIDGVLTKPEKSKLERGVVIEGKKTAPAKISSVQVKQGQTAFQITLHEGRKRQIRLMLRKICHTVIFLKRTHFGHLSLGRLPVGKFKKVI